ncbi:mechanosensitive ion channel domain-containing protein [Streptobacillus felis]|uniref:Mechanosensitive ion channel n=1 Tax=Streptobacillus felis TaxID=1384509 RepID=A0A7Z0TA95_9FUSO|nr:mechanosensitive ion channel domain-containing protein [Streptobacillus felis]NYV27772.1 mechanosensitive ion channel [Streptobacillus felis]
MEQVTTFLKKVFDLTFILKWTENNLLQIITGLVVLFFYKKIASILLMVFDKILFSKMKDHGLRSFLKSFLKVFIHIVLIYIVIGLFGFNLTSVFAIIGAMSVVIGFAFKEIIQNIFGGIILLVFKPFRVGDVVQYNSYIGTVKKIEMFYTRIVNFQNEIVIVPNGLLINNEIKNITAQNRRRLDLIIAVSYKSDLALVKEILEQIVNDCEYVLRGKDDNYTIGLGELAASSINFVTNVYVLPENYLLAKFYILEQVKKRFDAAGISIPYNQLDVHIKER